MWLVLPGLVLQLSSLEGVDWVDRGIVDCLKAPSAEYVLPASLCCTWGFDARKA
jgi:hypothetical protein